MMVAVPTVAAPFTFGAGMTYGWLIVGVVTLFCAALALLRLRPKSRM